LCVYEKQQGFMVYWVGHIWYVVFSECKLEWFAFRRGHVLLWCVLLWYYFFV